MVELEPGNRALVRPGRAGSGVVVKPFQHVCESMPTEQDLNQRCRVSHGSYPPTGSDIGRLKHSAGFRYVGCHSSPAQAALGTTWRRFGRTKPLSGWGSKKLMGTALPVDSSGSMMCGIAPVAVSMPVTFPFSNPDCL